DRYHEKGGFGFAPASRSLNGQCWPPPDHLFGVRCTAKGMARSPLYRWRHVVCGRHYFSLDRRAKSLSSRRMPAQGSGNPPPKEGGANQFGSEDLKTMAGLAKVREQSPSRN